MATQFMTKLLEQFRTTVLSCGSWQITLLIWESLSSFVADDDFLPHALNSALAGCVAYSFSKLTFTKDE